MFKRNLAILTIAGLTCGFLAPTASFADSQTKEELPQAYNVKSDKDLKDVLKNVSDEYKIKDNADQYELVKKEKDDLGFTHYTLKPKADGYFAEDAEVKIHTDKTGKVVFVNGDLNQGKLEVKNETKIDKEKAIQLAFNAIEKSRDEVKNLSGEDVVKEVKIAVDEKSNRAIYALDIAYTLPEAAHWIIKIDAENGSIVDKQNILELASQVSGTGVGTDGKVKNLNMTLGDDNKYVLLDTTHKGKIETLAFESFRGTGESWIIGNPITNIKNFFEDKAAVDAHYFANEVYNYYKNIHNRESYDNKGANIRSIVHIALTIGHWSNAAWNGVEMIYGDGDPETENPFASAKDVVAHEITHAVTTSSANLVYEFQSGALNESFSDVFGYFVDNDDWTMGEDLYKEPGKVMRDLQNPERCGQPAHMKDYQNSDDDRGGVHTNSGIPNKAAYNTITKIGQEKSEQIYYRALTKYLTKQSQFSDAKNSLIQSAKDLYGDKEANDVKEAWDKVGVN
ncbi:M4 family metallopeptidase [Paraclostridium ghonii]|uniref:Neutral metalloproteinase n=1 Tax=Paraclostridium ghonii TaxID=29358 RepID=A0ABU0N1X8_9FIRM|nr:M4 family metallopeptidase [Paeniclostridium ghonii]MDQ0557152.1 Zn-dependent metalloprotease [Paeniclostridium ghonii]